MAVKLRGDGDRRNSPHLQNAREGKPFPRRLGSRESILYRPLDPLSTQKQNLSLSGGVCFRRLHRFSQYLHAIASTPLSSSFEKMPS